MSIRVCVHMHPHTRASEPGSEAGGDIGHNYVGHNYIGHNYVGHRWAGEADADPYAPHRAKNVQACLSICLETMRHRHMYSHMRWAPIVECMCMDMRIDIWYSDL